MAGGASQLDLFDHKPELAKLEGKPIPPQSSAASSYAFIRSDAAVLGPRFKFKRPEQRDRDRHRRAAAPGGDHRRGVHDQVRPHRTNSIHAPARSSSTPAFPSPAAEHGIVGDLTASGPRPGTFPAFVVMSTGAGHQRRGGQLVERLPADHLRRRAIPQSGRSDPRRFQPGRNRSQAAA